MPLIHAWCQNKEGKKNHHYHIHGWFGTYKWPWRVHWPNKSLWKLSSKWWTWGFYTTSLGSRFEDLWDDWLQVDVDCNGVKLQATRRRPFTDGWHKYMHLVWSLIYLCNTRPDICFAVGVVSQLSNKPNETHWKVVLPVLKYNNGLKLWNLLQADNWWTYWVLRLRLGC